MTRRRDAVLALVVLGAAATAWLVADARPSVPAAVLGAVATLLLEAVLGRYERAVREWWERPWTQAGALLVALAAVTVGAALAPGPVLSAVTGGLVTYLLLLGLVTVAVVSAPSAWW